MKTYSNLNHIVITKRRFKDTIKFTNCSNIQLFNCEFERGSLYFVLCSGISVSNCSFINSNEHHSLQCDKSSDIYIGYNYFQENDGHSNVSDIISLYKSTGATVEHNYLIGGGPSTTGGGIMLGDNMGDNQTASNNICVDCGQYGIAIAGGTNNRIFHNVVMAQKRAWTNVGIYVWGISARNSTVANATVSDNIVSWTNNQGKSNPFWVGPNVFNLTKSGNVFNAPYNIPAKPADVGCTLDA